MGMRPFWYPVCMDKDYCVQTDVPYEEIMDWIELIDKIKEPVEGVVKIEVCTSLVVRGSVRRLEE